MKLKYYLLIPFTALIIWGIGLFMEGTYNPDMDKNKVYIFGLIIGLLLSGGTSIFLGELFSRYIHSFNDGLSWRIASYYWAIISMSFFGFHFGEECKLYSSIYQAMIKGVSLSLLSLLLTGIGLYVVFIIPGDGPY